MNSPSPAFSLLSLLRSSTTLKQIHQIHAQLLIRGHGFSLNNHLLAKLVDLRGIDHARSIFDRIPQPNDYSWTSMIRGYSINGPLHNSLLFFIQMQRDGVKPTNFTFPFVFKACSTLSAIKEGQQIHTHVLKLGLGSDIFVENSLIDMYGKCLRVESARQLFDEMSERDEVSWNSIVSGYVICGEMRAAQKLFDEMPLRRNVVSWTALINGYGRVGKIVEMLGLFRWMLVSLDDVKPNSATMVSLLSACSNLCNSELGRWVSIFIDVNRMPLDVILGTALMDMYSKCRNIGKARQLFDEIPERNLVSWNAMLTGYVQCRLPDEAIQLFYRMQSEFVKPNEITMVNLLSACADLGALDLGRRIHLYLGRNGLELNVILATALVDMYSKCGSINDARRVFIKMSKKDAALWNSMILGLATHGNGRDALTVFSQMERVGMRPNNITFIGVLSACSHSGLVDDGRISFNNMIRKYNLSPEVEHYSCMVDLLGRAGHLDEAFTLVQDMKVSPDSIIWGALLGACRIHRNVELADRVGQLLLLSEAPKSGICILLSNIYAAAGMWKDVARVRRLIKENRLRKPFGCSWIELDGIVHRFLVEDTAHKQSQEIYDMLKGLMQPLRIEGYVPNLDYVLLNMEDMQQTH